MSLDPLCNDRGQNICIPLLHRFYICEKAFYNCSGLTSVTIPDSVTQIGTEAFRDCNGLQSITIPFVGAYKNQTGATYFGYIFGASKYSENDEYVPESLKTVIISDAATSIGDYAFRGCSGLTSVTFKNPNNWQVSEYSNFYSPTSISSHSDPSTAAEYLTDTYCRYYWRRTA